MLVIPFKICDVSIFSHWRIAAVSALLDPSRVESFNDATGLVSSIPVNM